MRLIRKLRFSPAMVIGCAALAIALGGTGYAAVNALPRNSVTSVQVKDHSLLAKDFKRGQAPKGPRGAAGPAGPAGAAGPTGPAGPAGPGAKWALVNPNGSVSAQSGGISVSTHTTGQYILDFAAPVTGKLIIASSGFSNDTLVRGKLIAGPCGGTAEGFACSANNDSNHVIVRSYGSNNTTLQDHSFYIAVIG